MIPSIFLDNNATTPLAKEVLEEMISLYDTPLNPSSIHAFGRKGSALLLQAKESIASFLGVFPSELIFTSGGTESMNMLINGLHPQRGKILSSTIEHPCVDQSLNELKKKGSSVVYVPVDSYGSPKIETIQSLLTDDISLMVFSAVYSETGAKLDITQIAKLAEKRKIPLILDGVALLGKELFTIPQGVTAMGFSSHKIHGPKGVGLCFIRKGSSCRPFLYGGSQQSSLRPGTENIEGIVGFAKAVNLLKTHLPKATDYLDSLKKVFITTLLTELKARDNPHLDGIHLHIKGPTICNTLSIGFDDVDGEALLFELDRKGVMVSMGSACSSGALEPSKVLIEMGVSRKLAQRTLRFSFSRMNTKQEVIHAAQILATIVIKQRQLDPF